MSAFDVSGRTIIITGGAGLLGREYGRALSEARAQVVLADIDRATVEAAAASVASVGPVEGLHVDVTSEASVAQLVRTTLDRFGRVDGLVNNAALDPKVGDGEGGLPFEGFEQYPLATWEQVLAVNLTGMFLCAREVAPVMRRQQRGAIVNVSSTYGLVGPDQRLYASPDPQRPPAFKPVAYSVTKSGVIGLTRYLAAYWAGTGIRVNTLTPGGVRHRQPDDFADRYASRTPIGRMAEPHEMSGGMRFLLSDASSYMTGSNLVIDGGWTAW